MRSSLRLLCQLTLISTFGSHLQAAEEIQDNVPLDLVKALLLTNSPYEIRLYSDLPDNFPAIVIPDSAELLGSADMGHSQQAVLQVEGDGLQQRSQIMTSLEGLGYILLTQAPGSHPTQTGFVAPMFIPPQMQLQYCHDEHGMLTLRITAVGTLPVASGPADSANLSLALAPGQYNPFFVQGSSRMVRATSPMMGSAVAAANSVININATGGINNPRNMMNGMNCAQMLEQYSGRGQPGMMTNLSQYTPRMELPAAAVLPAAGGGSFSSGSLNGMESNTSMSIDWELQRLFTHFTDQISQQNWQVDSEVVGETSATATWTREVDELKLFGSLRVIKAADDQYRLQFSIQNLSGQ